MVTSRTKELLASALIAPCLAFTSALAAGQMLLQPKTMRELGVVDPRFVSFNVEAVEVTGGRFWKPYKNNGHAPNATNPVDKANQNQPAGLDAGLFQYRPPIDLSNSKLRKLANALSPAFLRVSGTWRNSTYFQNDDLPAKATPPMGFKGVMTRAEWKGVVDFARAINADLVTSVAISAGTRNSDGIWTPDQAKSFFEYTKSIGGHITATEFMNEPTFAVIGGAPRGYSAADFARDVKIFAGFLRKESPDTLFLGPGSIGEGVSMMPGAPMPNVLKTEDILRSTGPIFDVFSYHFYANLSRRCTGPKAAMDPEQTLRASWLQRNLTAEAFYAQLRDEFMPGKPIWLTETGEAACGGDPWAAEFLDSFRFMDQLGSLAQKGVKTVMVNTLASSDYGLLDEETLDPRPDYWAALLWKHTMGTHVLDPGIDLGPHTRVYAQCSAHQDGAVTVLVINLDKTADQVIEVPISGEQYSLTATNVMSRAVALNGADLHLTTDGGLPSITGKPFRKGRLRLAPLSINFLVFAKAHNSSCT